MFVNRHEFGENFQWGISTAAFQIEGAIEKHGKGKSIWDEFSKKKNKIFNNQNASIACDYYHKFTEDIYLIHQMNIPNYRFSISWARILPNGTGQINKDGIDFYNRLIDFCLELGIEPWITLYHWDLPLELQKKGGWTNREIIHWFNEYVAICINHFSDRVKKWMVLNEPMVFTGAGYFLGLHAPGEKGVDKFLSAVHHAVLCQSTGAKTIKSINPSLKVGSTFSYSHLEPYDQFNRRDEWATKKIDALINRLFLEPLLGLGYPYQELPFLNRIEKYIKNDDIELMPFNLDFIGLQNYTREMVKYSPLIPFVGAKIIKASKRNTAHTQMDWEIYPRSIYLALKRLSKYNGVNEIIVTENGAAFNDTVEGETINDTNRKEFLQNYISEVYQAKKEGVNVNGYFVWTLMDNFEWAEGYHPKFGLIHVDFETQKRTIKSSGKWYADFLKNN
jgi:beta-glucosidase